MHKAPSRSSAQVTILSAVSPLGRVAIQSGTLGLGFLRTFSENDIRIEEPSHVASSSKKSKISARLSRNSIFHLRPGLMPSPAPRYFFDRSTKPASVGSAAGLD